MLTAAQARARVARVSFALVSALAFAPHDAGAVGIDVRSIDEIEPVAIHIDQMLLKRLAETDPVLAFETAFEVGDELFETVFNAADGVGANVGNGQRFTRVPRADLRGAGEWKNHSPQRVTGPNAENCNACHNLPFDDGAGNASANVHRDPLRGGSMRQMIQRNTPHLFAPGAVQRLAEEMTADLLRIRAEAIAAVCATGSARTANLEAKGVRFGSIRVSKLRESRGSRRCNTRVDTAGVRGVDPDLVIRPFQWKGNRVSLRDFNRDAAHNELGIQSVELVGDGVDGDFDGVRDEMTVGDQTALAVYLAAQPRPTSLLELDGLGLLEIRLGAEQKSRIRRGAALVQDAAVGCATCHVSALSLEDATFSEPSQSASHRDSVFPAGQSPVARGVDPRSAVTFDLTQDQPDNILHDAGGNVRFRLGSLRTDSRSGRALVELGGDLKRHDMGAGLAEPVDETGTGASVFLTENLWGVGSTAPYLHDGRATTLREAILLHGGEAETSRNAFARLARQDQAAVIAYLENLVLFKIEEEE
jgi:cytochrome c peroxidase